MAKLCIIPETAKETVEIMQKKPPTHHVPEAISLIFPVSWNCVASCAVSHGVRHDGILESFLISLHQYWLAFVFKEHGLYILAVVGRWEIYLYFLVRIIFVDKLDRRDKVAVCAYKNYSVGRIENAVSHHPDRNIHICLFLFGRDIEPLQ